MVTDYRYDYLFEENDLNNIEQAKTLLKNEIEKEIIRREVNTYTYVRINNYTKVLRKCDKINI